MRTFFLFILFLSLGYRTMAQELNKKIEDPYRHQQVMLNQCTREGLISLEEFKASYESNYQSYTVDSTQFESLKPLLADKKITIVLGTWCGDSKFQVPHFLKITDALEFPADHISYIAVDGQKKAENGLIDHLNIQRVPTFIVFNQEGKEIGRIIERPQESLEKDLLKILQKTD